jgi:hypothetical protein
VSRFLGFLGWHAPQDGFGGFFFGTNQTKRGKVVIRHSAKQYRELEGIEQTYIYVKHTSVTDRFYWEAGVIDLEGKRAALVSGETTGKSFQHDRASGEASRALHANLKLLADYAAKTKPEIDLT